MAESKLACNPFNLPRHAWASRKKNLRSVTKWMCEQAPISMGSKICDTCRRKLKRPYRLPDDHSARMESVRDEEPRTNDAEDLCDEFEEQSSALCADSSPSSTYIDFPTAIASLNKYLVEVGATPFTRTKASQPYYLDKKMKEITKSMEHLLISEPRHTVNDDDSEMIKQLKDKFKITMDRATQMQILTVLPQSWSVSKIQSEFGVTTYMARKSKELVKDKGILSTPNPKPGPSLSLETTDLIIRFYESDDISRVMPGKKDFVSVKQERRRVHVQKRLVLSNLKEAYIEFKNQFPTQKVGFSKFAELWPKHCVLAGASGTHSVCVCTIHQNVKLMLLAVKLSQVPTYHDCMAKILCGSPLPSCYLGSCALCPGISAFKDYLTTCMDENLVDNVTYKQWVSVDRSTLETFSMPADEFVEAFCDKLELLRPHCFIAREQAGFYKACKDNLVPGEMLVTVDFSENYAFVLQDSAQGYHWNNSQATIHPFVAYYRDADKLCHLSYVVVSDCLHHDTTAVYLFQKAFIAFIRRVLPRRCQPRKIIYFSDGAASQYKNRKNFVNLCHHEKDFGISAQWHFSATSHGKGACDGLGGTVKRLAAKASLQRPYNEQIMTARQLFDWASTMIPAVHFDYCANEDYLKEQHNLEERFQASRTIPGTRKLHSFLPISDNTVHVRPFSASTTFKEEKVTSQEAEISLESISGFVTCVREGYWWLACVLQVVADESQVRVTFLHPHGPSSSFKYPGVEDVKSIPTADVLTIADPRTRTSRSYTLLKKESKLASERLNALLQ